MGGTLTTALGASIRGLNVVQEGVANSSHNIANADTPGYIRQDISQKSLVTDGVGQGATIAGYSSAVDEQLLSDMKLQTTVLGESSTLKEFYDSLQRLYGQPGLGNGLSDQVDNFFASLQSLSDNPGTASLRLSAVTAGVNVANKVSDIAQGLQSQRFEADKQITQTITQINSLIVELANTNSQIGKFPEGSSGRLNIEQIRNSKLEELSELTNISYVVDGTGLLSITMADGASILDANIHKLSYIPASSANTFINNNALNAITVYTLDSSGSIVSSTSSVDIVSSGRSANVESSVTGGKLKALIDLRDSKIPDLLSHLDNLADVITDQMNAIHNDGSSFPPQSSMTGTKAVTSTTEIGFSGSVRIAVINSDGTPPASPYSGEQYLRPLTLDLGSLNSGSGAGQPTVQSIIDEINDFYGPPQALASVGNLRDIKLGVLSTSINDSSSFQFDFNLDSVSATGSRFEVTGISLSDGGAAGLASALPAAYSVSAGDYVRTGSSNAITVNLAGGSGGPYTLTANVKVTAADGTVSTANITYQIKADGSEEMNDRIHAASVTQTSSTGSASFVSAPSSQRLATATLVDADGNEVSAGNPGYLKITTTSGESYGVAIDELDSKEIGLPTTATSDITYRGFSHYFGMNNFFVENSTTSGSAINMAVRSDIAANPNLIATGDLNLSVQPSDASQALYTYELGKGNNNIVTRLAAAGSATITFDAAGTLPQESSSISGYSGDIVGFVATAANSASANYKIENLGMDGLKNLFQQQGGVNTDEELAKIMELENAFRASTSVISTVKNMFERLTSVFN